MAPQNPHSPEPLLRDRLGLALRLARTAQGRTLAQVAEQAGLSTQYLSEIERGLKDPSSEILAAAAGALGLELRDLLVFVLSSMPAPRTLSADAGPTAPSMPPTFAHGPHRTGEVSLALAA